MAALEEQQLPLLEDATRKVKEQAFYMKRAADSSNLKETLNHAKEMLRELRTAQLTPRNYYDLVSAAPNARRPRTTPHLLYFFALTEPFPRRPQLRLHST